MANTPNSSRCSCGAVGGGVWDVDACVIGDFVVVVSCVLEGAVPGGWVGLVDDVGSGGLL